MVTVAPVIPDTSKYKETLFQDENKCECEPCERSVCFSVRGREEEAVLSETASASE